MAMVRLEGLDTLKKFNDLIGNRIRDLPALTSRLNRLRYSVRPRNNKQYRNTGMLPLSPANMGVNRNY
jgi:hypothetical protein